MAFLHSQSSECAKSELDLFKIPPTQTSIEESHWTYYNPVTTISDDSPIEFQVPGHGEEYIDLAHTMLKVKLKVVKPDGSWGKDDPVAPVDNVLHSLFSQVDVLFNQKAVTSSSNTYPYRAYIENLLNYGKDARSTHLQLGCFFADEEGLLEEKPLTGKNAYLNNRAFLVAEGQSLELMGHLHCDVFNQEKFLLNGVEMKVALVRSKDAFCLMDYSASKNYKIQIQEVTLFIRRVKLSPTILLAHTKALSKTTAKYPLTRVEVKSFILSSGIHSNTIDNVVLGSLPKRVILGFVDNRAFTGSRGHNPFNFQNFDINYLCLYVDGKQIPGKPLQPSFTTPLCDAESYQTLFSGTGIHFGDHGHCVSRSKFIHGYTLFAFDLTPDLSAHSSSHWNLVKTGSLRIEVRFKTALPATVNCIVFTEYDNILEIDSSRQVIIDYSA